MTRTAHIVRDASGIIHRFEAAAWHNTRCGERVENHTRGVPWIPIGGRDGAMLPDGIVDCMACLAGQSHLSVLDLRDGIEVQAWVRLDSKNGPVGSAQPITFTRGENVNEVTFDDLPVGIPVYGYYYLSDDGRVLHCNGYRWPQGLTRRNENDTITILVGSAEIQ